MLRSVLRHLGCLVVACWLLANPSFARGSDPNELRFRRVEVPLEKTADFVEGLIPRPRAEFESLIRPHDPARQTHPEFDFANYSAELEGENLVGGRASLQLHRPNERSVTQDRFVPFEGNLSITRSSWRDHQGQLRPATVGGDENRRVVLLDPQADLLQFQWTHRGTLQRDVLGFDLRFPESLIYQLQITTPIGVVVQTNRGVVSQEAVLRDAVDWLIEWSGRPDIRVSIHPERDSGDEAGKPKLTQATTYSFRPSELKLRNVLDVSPGADPMSLLTIDLDAALQITRVQSDQRPLFWTMAGDDTLLIELPYDPRLLLRDTSVPIQVDAVVQVPRGKIFQLPRMRVREVDWISGRMRWRVQYPLEVTDLQLQGCRCLEIQSTGDSAETFEFVLDSDLASVQLRLDGWSQQNTAEVLVEALVENNSVLADVEVRFRPLRGELFSLPVGVDFQRGWVLDKNSVEAEALNGLTSVIDRLDQQNDRIEVRLRQGAALDNPVTVRFRMRNDALGPQFALNELMPLFFDADASVWVYVRGGDGVELTRTNTELFHWQREHVATLPEWIEERHTPNSTFVDYQGDALRPGDMFFQHSEATRFVAISRNTRAAPTIITSMTTVSVDHETWRYVADLQVDPGGKELDQISVRFSRPVPVSGWSLDSLSRESPSVTPVSKLAHDAAGMATYRIGFQPTKQPIRLRFEFEAQHHQKTFKVPMVVVDDAVGSAGTVVVYDRANRAAVEVNPGDGLNTLPFSQIAHSSLSELRQVRGVYSYNNTAPVIPTLDVRPRSEANHASLWAWRCDIRSYYSEKGRPRHRADYYLQNDGATSFQVTLPDGYALEGVEVNGVAATPGPVVTDGTLTVGLPKDDLLPCVSVRYVQPEKALNWIDWLKPPSPLTDISTLQTIWHVWLPRDYHVYLSGELDARQNGWLARLVGRFADQSRLPVGHSLARYLRRRLLAGGYNASVVTGQFVTGLGRNRIPEQLGSQTPDGPDPAVESWASRLAVIQQLLRRARPDFQLLIDRQELRRLGLNAEAALPESRYRFPRQRGEDRLRQAGLAIILDGERAILTSTSEVNEHATEAELLAGVAIEGSQDWFASTRLLPLDQWRLDRWNDLWRPSQDSLEIGLQAGGWNPYRQSIGDLTPSLKIYHRDTIIALACSLFFVGFALGWWLASRGPRRWLMASSIAVAAALVLPQPGATLSICLAWSIVVSVILRSLSTRRRPVRSMLTRSSARLDRTRAALWIVTVLGATIVDSEIGRAQDIKRVPIVRAEQVGDGEKLEQRVVVPRDKQGKLGSVVYLSPEFYRALRRRAADSEPIPGYLVTRSVYSGAEPVQPNREVLDLQARYSVTVLRADVLIPLPIFGPGVTFDSADVKLDQRQVTVNDHEMPGRFSIRIPRPGDYQITIGLQALIRAESNRRWCQFPIPRVAQSQLELELPRNLKSASVPSAIGKSDIDLKRGRLSADLGPASLLKFELTVDEPNGKAPPDVDQMILIRFIDGKAQIETRFRFAGNPVGLRLDVDRRLASPLEINPRMKWDPESREMRLDVLGEEEGPRFEMDWLLPGGQFELPRLVPLDVSVNLRSRMIAIETPPSTQADVNVPNLTLISRTQFAKAWGSPIPSGLSTFLRVDQDAPFKFRIIGAEPPMNWNNEVIYFFDPQRIAFRVTAEMRPVTASTQTVTVRRLVVPQSLRVEEIRATNSFGVPLRLRWRRANDGAVVLLFLDRPEMSATSPIEISLQGELTYADSKRIELPLMAPSTVRGSSVTNKVTLYCRPNVELEPDASAGVALSPDEGSTPQPGYRFAGGWASGSTEAINDNIAFAVSTRWRQLDLRGTLTTTLLHEVESWLAEATVLLQDDDLGDALFFEVPSELVDLKLTAREDNVELRVDEAISGPGVGRHIVTVWLPERTTVGPRTITLSATMAQEQTRLPRIKLLNVDLDDSNQPRHFVQLPLSSDWDTSTVFSWTVSGMAEEPSDGRTTNLRRYRVVQRDYGASLDQVETASQQAEIFLLDTILRWKAPDHYLSMSQYDLKPARASECFLEIPATTKLVHVLVDNTRILVERIDRPASNESEARWRIPLASSPWPQRVLIVCEGLQRVPNGGRIEFQAPRLISPAGRSIPIRRELWSVYGDTRVGNAQLIDQGDEEQNAAQRNEAVLAAFADLWNGSQRSLQERSREEKTAWLRAWSLRLERISARSEALPIRNQEVQLPTINEIIADYPEVFDSALPREVPIAQLELWNESQRTGNSLLLCSSTPPIGDALPRVSIRYPVNRTGNAPLRYALALVLVISAVVLPRVNAFKHALFWADRFPHLIGVFIGLVWWFVLSPKWFGAIIVLVVVAIWLWGAIRQRQLRLPQ